MKSVVCRHTPGAKVWKSSSSRCLKGWQLPYSRQSVAVAEEVALDYEHEQSRGRTRRRRQPVAAAAPGSGPRQPDPNDRHSSAYRPGSNKSNGSNGSHSVSNGSYRAAPATEFEPEHEYDVGNSTDRTQLINWRSSSRSRSRARRTSASPVRQAAPSSYAPASPPAATAPAPRARSSGRSVSTSRGRSLERRKDTSPAPPAANAGSYLGLPSASRSRSRSRSPSPVPELDAIKSWLAKSPSPAPRSAPPAQASAPAAAKAAAPAAAPPRSRSRSTTRARSRSRARSPSPLRDASVDPELEKMKTWLDNHKDDNPVAVKPYELVARGHSPARVASPERTPASTSTPKASAPAKKPAGPAPAAAASPVAAADAPVMTEKPGHHGNGVIDLSNLPSSQKHHVREVYVEDLPQTHADYGRALKEVTEVTSVMGWAKAQKHEDEHAVPEVPVVMASKAKAAGAGSTSTAQGGAFSDPALQGTLFTSLAYVSAAFGVAALLGPQALLQACFGGATALEATLTRVIGSGVIISAACNLCLQDASSHNRLGSATYQRLMGAGVWQSLTAAAVLAFHASLCTPVLALLVAPLAVAGLVGNSGVLSAATGSPLPPPITLVTPTTSSAIAYAALSASLLLSAAACFLPLGLIHGSISYNLPVLHHLCAPGLLATAIVACVLQDAANRDRLGASTFKKLNLGMTAALGALALSLAAGLNQLLVVPTLVTLPVLGVTGAGAVFCLLMFALSKKQQKA